MYNSFIIPKEEVSKVQQEPFTGEYMSPVSPVFHPVVTVRIGLKTQLEKH